LYEAKKRKEKREKDFERGPRFLRTAHRLPRSLPNLPRRRTLTRCQFNSHSRRGRSEKDRAIEAGVAESVPMSGKGSEKLDAFLASDPSYVCLLASPSIIIPRQTRGWTDINFAPPSFLPSRLQLSSRAVLSQHRTPDRTTRTCVRDVSSPNNVVFYSPACASRDNGERLLIAHNLRL